MIDPYRLERIERLALQDLHAAADDALRRRIGLTGRTIGDAFVSCAKALPDSAIVINRAIGLGLETRPTPRSTLDEIVTSYRDERVDNYFLHVHPGVACAELEGWLEAHELRPARGWTKFSRGREAPEPVESSLNVRAAVPGDEKIFGRIVCDAFDLGNAAVPWIGSLIMRRGWHVYLSLDGDKPVGGASMFVKDHTAWFDWGATLPEYRGRGSQSLLLRRRIKDALDMAVDQFGTTTGEAVPGDPQHSYHNIEKAGFEPVYVRKNYSRASSESTQ